MRASSHQYPACAMVRDRRRRETKVVDRMINAIMEAMRCGPWSA